MGRVPIGRPIPVKFTAESAQQLREVGASLGQRRTSAVVRVAIRALLRDPKVVTREMLSERSGRTERLLETSLNFHMEDELRNSLDRLAAKKRTSRAELVRIAVDLLLIQIETDREQGRPDAIGNEVTAEIYRGEANRDRLIARRAKQRGREG
jgi:predicted transcriptional regulator